MSRYFGTAARTRRLCILLSLLAGLLVGAGCSTGSSGAGSIGTTLSASERNRRLASAIDPNPRLASAFERVCPRAPAGYAQCELLLAKTGPSGYGPADLSSAYNLSGDVGGGSGATVAVIDAYDDPNLESDLAVYRANYGLTACSSSSGCLRKVNQNGGSKLPSGNESWGAEESLDVDMVSALCPNCSILLVEAKSASLNDLGQAVSEAAKLNATTISTAFSGSEFKGEDSKSPYDAGRPVTAAGGDSGFGVGYPAALPFVIAVGATTLTQGGGGSRGWTETADGGGGCAKYAAKPKWQKDDFCKTRTDNDVAFVGSPSTGVAIYDSYGFGGWLEVGGTSVGASAIAAIYALAGNTHGIKNAKGLYEHALELYDIPPTGYDEATGNGTPDSTAAF